MWIKNQVETLLINVDSIIGISIEEADIKENGYSIYVSTVNKNTGAIGYFETKEAAEIELMNIETAITNGDRFYQISKDKQKRKG